MQHISGSQGSQKVKTLLIKAPCPAAALERLLGKVLLLHSEHVRKSLQQHTTE